MTPPANLRPEVAEPAGDGPVGWFVGLATLDVIQRVDRLPERNEKITAERSWLAAGGPAAVAAIAFSRLGGRAVLWTALGSGPAAAVVRADLASVGVDVVDAAPEGFELATSTAFVDASSGDRAVVSGSAHRPSFGEVGSPDFAGVDVLLVDGHHPALALAASRAAATAAVRVVVDAGSHKPVFDDLFVPGTDVLCSADYVHPSGRSGAELLALGPRLVAVSGGGEELRWWSSAGEGRIAPAAVVAVDTLGAGDVLHGAYAFALASGLAGTAALAYAVDVATERVRHLGPFAWRERIAATRSGARSSGAD